MGYNREIRGMMTNQVGSVDFFKRKCKVLSIFR